MFKFLLSMLLALHTFPCFLSPFPHLIWNLEKFHSSQILEFTEPSSSSAVHYPLVYFQSVTCHVSGSTARAGVWLDWLEMQLETGAGLEFLRTTGIAFSGSSTHRSEVGLDDLKGLSQPSKSWDSVLVHRDALTWRRERRNLRLSYGELISV